MLSKPPKKLDLNPKVLYLQFDYQITFSGLVAVLHSC